VDERYHIRLDAARIEGARAALLPGDPDRVPRIARELDEPAHELAWKREFRSWIGRIGGTPVLVVSTGIGGPSTSVAVEELAQLGVRTFLRVGTSGAIQPEIDPGDVVITTGAVRLDGASRHYAPIEYPAVAHPEVVAALIAAARSEEVPWHAGITASSDTFYPGQERVDSYSGRLLRRFQGQTDELRGLHVLNYEMESATLLTMCAALGLRAGCVTGVAAQRATGEEVGPEALAAAERHAIRVGVEAMRSLVGPA